MKLLITVIMIVLVIALLRALFGPDNAKPAEPKLLESDKKDEDSFHDNAASNRMDDEP